MDRMKFGAPAEFLNPLAQIFFVINLINGVVFTFFSYTAGVSSISFVSMAPHLVVPFGMVLLVLSLMNIYVLATEHYYIGTAAAMLGFATWLYMAIMYFLGGLWFAMIIYPLPQVAFWSWYFFAVKKLKE